MKVVLSRKGFDSGYGRVPSPILPDGRMISLPIPDKDAPTRYEAIQRDGFGLGAVVAGLGARRGKPAKPIMPSDLAHLDPDLDAAAMPRPPGWRPIFGQESAAFGHLRNQGVGPGDLFLFFGWFRPVLPVVNGQWRYAPGRDPVHAIWGWMRVGAMHPCPPPPDVAAWATGHPHLYGPQRTGNTVFVAADDLVVGGHRVPGAGLFACKPERILTDEGHSLSTWRLPAWMHPAAGVATLSYHLEPDRWSAVDEHGCRVVSAPKGQEFVLKTKDTDRLDAWLVGLFADVPSLP